MKKAAAFIRNNPVVTIAVAAAAVTCFFVPPDALYAQYFDLSTLSCLFCTLAVISALKNINFFSNLARRIVLSLHTVRSAVTALIFITYIGSMIIANDMALLTFLPLSFFVLDSTGNRKLMPVTFTLQTLAANLGGMLTPFGNPQNLYLYSYYSFSDAEFFTVMLPPFVLSLIMIAACCILIKPRPLTLVQDGSLPTDNRRAALYIALFALCIAAVFRLIPYWAALIATVAVLLFADRSALAHVDYLLLLTFCAFFVFSGNLSRIERLHAVIDSLASGDTLLLSVVSCQLISNVPTAVLLSHFSVVPQQLLMGVNIGGAGTLIASLASLITFREYRRHEPENTKRYLLWFCLLNFGFLLVLLAACELLCRLP